MDSETTDGNNLGLPPKIAVDLATELLEESDVLPTSRDCESDTDVSSPPAMAVMEVDVAAQEISKLLLEIPSGQPPASEAAAYGPGLDLSML